MVYCSKCGTKNDDNALYCVKCGTKLTESPKTWEKQMEDGAEEFGKRMEEWGENFGKQFENGECFGLVHAGLAFGLIIGILIVAVGVLLLVGIEIWNSFWAIALIMFGALILGGTIYSITRKH
ncbi:MAG: zinc-ribbon domain-containing protein [Candidatus Bathyarchaeota archaeon]|nr:zinc-ribbon domain-containing protein [Candidatus Bathyarchaeota archaeon]